MSNAQILKDRQGVPPGRLDNLQWIVFGHPAVQSSERPKVIHLYSAPKVQFLTMVLACSFVLMNPTEIAKYNESQEQWLLELLSRRQDLSIQTAKVDVEISVVRGVLRARETAKANGVVEGGEPSVEDAARKRQSDCAPWWLSH
jgi:hypothetical protein